jgi:hypothetical protein
MFDNITQRFGIGTLILVAFLLVMGLGGYMIISASDQLLKFVYIVPVIFLFLAIAAFLLILLHYAVVLQRTIPGLQVTALGLPEGSVRAFLAIGLLALVAVFGAFLYFESRGGSYPEAGLAQIDNLDAAKTLLGERFILVPDAAETARATSAYEKQEIARAAKASADHVAAVARATQAKQEPPPEPANTKPNLGQKNVYRVVSTTLDTSRADLAKQLLVMITTLLTTVVGFYFGSRTGEGGTPGDLERRATVLQAINAALQKNRPVVTDLTKRLNELDAQIGSVPADKQATVKDALKQLRDKVENAEKSLQAAMTIAAEATAKTDDLEATRKKLTDADVALATAKAKLDATTNLASLKPDAP